jgi:crossover junction endodeoxyribonuclease RuvC
MKTFAGIDPGLHGAIAIIKADNGAIPHLIAILDVPLTGDAAKQRVNTLIVRDWLLEHNPDHAIIERAGSMPGQGVASAFKYGRAVGSLETVIACSSIPHSIIEPAAWKKFHHLRGDKEASRQRILQLYPAQHSLFALKRHHNRAEAVLIALFGIQYLALAKADPIAVVKNIEPAEMEGAR